ncbi:CENP-B N-terminal DNA-binding domain [Popillia japonica]|uniref:CENP-B N-terminal DNA-binding domain n=1 Tax=Popillia japonica TaxID=7064 RepID=A0AAW1MH35_POPJA
MPRHYRRDPHMRPHKKHSADVIQRAREALRNGKSIRQASKDFSVPYTVLQRHIKHPNTIKTVGGQTVLSAAEEKAIGSGKIKGVRRMGISDGFI